MKKTFNAPEEYTEEIHFQYHPEDRPGYVAPKEPWFQPFTEIWEATVWALGLNPDPCPKCGSCECKQLECKCDTW